MADQFDPYREALVMEQMTIWPDEFDHWELDQRQQLEQQLHHSPEEAQELDYLRTHSGFCRQITVTQADLNRIGVKTS